jgi:hypothetical protein
MSDFCPEWIFGVSCGVTARDFLSSENSINSISRKFSKGLSERFKEIKFEEITECAESILQFLNDINAGDEAVDYLNNYIYYRIGFKSNGAERKLSGMFSSALDGEKTKDYDTEKSTKVFRATIFGIRNNTIAKTPAGWSIGEVEDLDWLGELIEQPVDILDSF